MPRTSETVLEIDLNALEHNYNYLRSRLKPKTKFLGVVKAYAYGSNTNSIVQKLDTLGVEYFAVAYVKEGVALRKAGIKKPILVLHPQPINFQELISNCLEPSLYSPKILRDFLEMAKRRLGFWENDVDYIIDHLNGRNEVIVASVFSHLAASDDLNEKQFTQHQITIFKKIAKEVDEKLGYIAFKHLLNTSGIINFPDAQFDMVRSGIGLYGYGNDKEIDAELKPVATLKTIISQLHKIEPHESVGYNRAYTSESHRTTATLPIGHADGIGRQYGNGKAFVNVKGQLAPIIGNVCMDMIMVDVTNIDCKEGDEVTIFGENPTAEEFASYANTISYELITGISQRVKRLYKGI